MIITQICKTNKIPLEVLEEKQLNFLSYYYRTLNDYEGKGIDEPTKIAKYEFFLSKKLKAIKTLLNNPMLKEIFEKYGKAST